MNPSLYYHSGHDEPRDVQHLYTNDDGTTSPSLIEYATDMAGVGYLGYRQMCLRMWAMMEDKPSETYPKPLKP